LVSARACWDLRHSTARPADGSLIGMNTTVTTKPTIIHRFFDELALRGSEPLLHNVTGTIEWNIKDVGRWWVRMNHGAVHVSQSPQNADCVASCDAVTFAGIINGKENLMAAALRGAVHSSGNVALGLSFQRLLR
jgi:predicted lipid carrier protein YhbT